MAAIPLTGSAPRWSLPWPGHGPVIDGPCPYQLSDQARRSRTLFGFHIPNTFRADELMVAHLEFGEELALAALAVMEAGAVDTDGLTAIGVQGANLIHAIAGHEGEPRNGHMEVGELAVVAERTGAWSSATSARATSARRRGRSVELVPRLCPLRASR